MSKTEVAAVLDRARDEGNAVEQAAIRQELGIGHDDLLGVLSELREAGEAVEAAPGEWRRPFEDERVRRTVAGGPGDGEVEIEEGVGPLRVHESSEETLAEAEARAAGGRRRSAVVGGDGEVKLTMAVASALDAQTIGKLVEAGIAEAKTAGRPFVLRVEP